MNTRGTASKAKAEVKNGKHEPAKDEDLFGSDDDKPVKRTLERSLESSSDDEDNGGPPKKKLLIAESSKCG